MQSDFTVRPVSYGVKLNQLSWPLINEVVFRRKHKLRLVPYKVVRYPINDTYSHIVLRYSPLEFEEICVGIAHEYNH